MEIAVHVVEVYGNDTAEGTRARSLTEEAGGGAVRAGGTGVLEAGWLARGAVEPGRTRSAGDGPRRTEQTLRTDLASDGCCRVRRVEVTTAWDQEQEAQVIQPQI